MDFGFFCALGVRVFPPPVTFPRGHAIQQVLAFFEHLREVPRVSSIFSDWLVSSAAAVNEWPVWQLYLAISELFISHRMPPQFGQLYGTWLPKPFTLYLF
jgi:hypothetical protein